MSDLLKVRVGGRDYLCRWEEPNYVVIGGRKYKTVKIGNRLWMAENLDWQWDGIDFYEGTWGTSVGIRCCYYGGGVSPIIAGYGLMYSWDAADYLETNKNTMLPEGWHVPKQADYNELITQINSIEPLSTGQEGLYLKSTTGWNEDGNGNDFFKFNGLPGGIMNHYTRQFEELGRYTTFWTDDMQSSSRVYGLYLGYNNNLFEYDTLDRWHGISIRLVKDAT